VAVQDPVQLALHFVVQSAVVGTDVHWVVQWSSQQAPHDASQSVEDDEEEVTEPSSVLEDDEDEEEHDALHPDEHRWLQSVVQSSAGGLVAHDVVQLDSQFCVQLASAEAVHCALHCCSSCAAHAFSQTGGAHWVLQLLFRAR
jgi:hypothetical protein